jgi:hypothetical protein
MLQKLRTAMVRPGRDRLHGPVEVDEAYVAGIEQGVRGRATECKFIIAIAVEVLSPKGFGLYAWGGSTMSLVPTWFPLSRPQSNPARRCARTAGRVTTVCLDKGTVTTPSTSLPAGIRPTFPCLQYTAWPPAQTLAARHHQGSVTAEYLDAYLNEFAFRFNRRHSRRRGLLFLRLMEYAVVTAPTRYRPPRSNCQARNHNI